MLKRFQVLLEDWQADYLRVLMDLYDLSFSEANRFLFSLGALKAIDLVFPEYDVKIDKDVVKKFINEKATQEERHKILSKLYFETRKAVEYRTNKLRKRKK
jgi:hypothetical protein